MLQHLKALGVLTILYHGLLALIILVILPLFWGIGFLSNSAEAAGVLGVIGLVVTILVLVVTLPGIIGGIALLRGRAWGRILVMIANAIYILSFPFGTALAVYTFWVLTKGESIAILEGEGGLQ